MKNGKVHKLIFLCAAVIPALAVLSFAARTSPQQAPAGFPGAAPAAGGVVAGPTEPGAMPQPEFRPGPNVWVEAVFVELDRAKTRDFEKTLGFKLSPPDGKATLNAEDKEKILVTIEETEGARIIASSSVLTVSGQNAQAEHVEELTYATEFKREEGGITPGNWQQRDLGAILNVTPTVLEDGRVAVVIMPQVTTLAGWKQIDGTEITQPVFNTWCTTTTVIIPDGSTFVLKGAPIMPFFRSQAIDPEAAMAPENQKTLLTIISAKVVEAK